MRITHIMVPDKLKPALFTINFLCILFQDSNSYKICSSNSNSPECQQLARSHELACHENFHDVDCMLNVKYKKSHIGKIKPEEAFLGARFLPDSIVVLGAVNSHHPPLQTAVIVKQTISDGFINLKGKKLCHPGFKHISAISNMILKQFDEKIQYFDDRFCTATNNTILEKEVNSLAKFLGDSCRPGPWSEDSNLDKILKQKYPSLCKLCGDQKCDVDYKAPFNDSLKCLIQNDGDIAITTIFEAGRFFQNTSNVQNYKYLCEEDGRISSESCSWTNQTNCLIIADRSAAPEIKSYLENSLQSRIANEPRKSADEETSMQQAFAKILDLGRSDTITLFTGQQSLKDYVKERRTIPSIDSNIKCGQTMKWCVRNSAELQKCKWLSQAAVNQAIQPILDCILTDENTELSCLKDIQLGKADLTVVSTDYGYISYKKGLINLAYPETDTRNLSTILLVTRSDDQSITGFGDLKGKGACIPEYGGKEFLSFIDTISTQKIVLKSSDYGQVIYDFVGNSCISGARDPEREALENIDVGKLCQCVPMSPTKTATYCNADTGNKYYGSEGALRCLQDSAGSFAVITKGSFPDVVDADFRVICKNGSLASDNGFNVDPECALAIITSSVVVSKNDNPLNPDIKLALRNFEFMFNQNLRTPFQIFNVFNGTLDLLFKDSTPGLSFEGDTEYIKNYKQLIDNINSDQKPNGSTSLVASTMTVFYVLLSFYIAI